MTALLLVLISAEIALLAFAERIVLWDLYEVAQRRPIVRLVIAGSIVIHEFSHYLACKLLGATVLSVRWFSPKHGPDGMAELGRVEYEVGDYWRMALISLAPLILVPALTLIPFVALFGHGLPANPLVAVVSLLFALPLALIAGLAAFPSQGDKIGAAGLALIGLALLVVLCLPSDIQYRVLLVAALIPAPSAGTVGAFLLWRHSDQIKALARRHVDQVRRFARQGA